MLATVHRCANLHTHKHACIPYIHTLNKHLDIFFKINIICIPLETLRAEVHVHIRMCTCVCIFEQTYIVMYPHTSFSESHCSENGKAKGIQLSCRSLWWRHLTAVKKKQRLQTWACEEREWVGNIFSCIFLKDTQPYGHPHFSPLRTVLDFRPTPYKKAKLCQRRTLYLFAVFVNRKNKFIQETKTDTTERMGEIIIIVQHSQHTFGNVGN